jgi:hypothetical protein
MPLRGLDANGAERQSRSRSPMAPTVPLTLSIVVPAFNEERRLAATLATLCEYLGRQPWDWEVRVVDDGSADDTAGMAESFSATRPRVVVQREPHRGKGGAVKAGLTAAPGEIGSSVTPTCRCRWKKSAGSCRRWPLASTSRSAAVKDGSPGA